MQIPILIEPIEGGRFRAREPFGLAAEGDTADAAARVLEVYIRQRLDAGVLRGKANRVAHVKGRARPERRHVVRREIGIGMNHPNRRC